MVGKKNFRTIKTKIKNIKIRSTKSFHKIKLPIKIPTFFVVVVVVVVRYNGKLNKNIRKNNFGFVLL